MPARKPPPAPRVKIGHRPAYEPTPAGRSQVAAMVIADIDQAMIATCLRITPKTLRRHYRRELDTSYAIIKAEIAGKLVTKARGGDFASMRFYLATHGWVESERLVVADGGIDDSDVTQLSDAQIAARIQALSRKRPRA